MEMYLVHLTRPPKSNNAPMGYVGVISRGPVVMLDGIPDLRHPLINFSHSAISWAEALSSETCT